MILWDMSVIEDTFEVKAWCFTIQNRVFWKIQVWDEMHVRTWVLDGVGML